MKLVERLAANKSTIVKKWFDLVAATYPPDTAKFLKANRDPFHNPVGKTTLEGLSAAFDALLEGADPVVLDRALDPIIRIRAVQSFSPTQATAFILALKPLVRELWSKGPSDPQAAADLRQIEDGIDQVLLVAFDIYLKCRETLFQLKVDLEKNRIHHAFVRAGLVADTPVQPSAAEPKGAV
jgi:hypothetical protein